MPRRFGNYLTLYKRIEEEFDIDSVTSENLREYLGMETSGRIGLADSLGQISVISEEIDDLEDVSELRKLKREILKQPIFRFKLLGKADNKIEELLVLERERKIAEGIVRVERFALEKRIVLSEKKIGREENWKGKSVFTIRDDKGRFISWRPK